MVIAIIALLSVLGATNYQQQQRKARDAQRRADLERIRMALETYKADYDEYPESDGRSEGCDSSIGTCGTDQIDSDGNGVIDEVRCRVNGCTLDDWDYSEGMGPLSPPPVGEGYLSRVPRDPLNNQNFYYRYRTICGFPWYNIGTGDARGTFCGIEPRCDNNICCAYELSARLEDGTTYTICNLN